MKVSETDAEQLTFTDEAMLYQRRRLLANRGCRHRSGNYRNRVCRNGAGLERDLVVYWPEAAVHFVYFPIRDARTRNKFVDQTPLTTFVDQKFV